MNDGACPQASMCRLPCTADSLVHTPAPFVRILLAATAANQLVGTSTSASSAPPSLRQLADWSFALTTSTICCTRGTVLTDPTRLSSQWLRSCRRVGLLTVQPQLHAARYAGCCSEVLCEHDGLADCVGGRAYFFPHTLIIFRYRPTPTPPLPFYCGEGEKRRKRKKNIDHPLLTIYLPL